MTIKTVVPRQSGVYAAFPTFVEHRGNLFVFYRRAHADRGGPHGSQGEVRRLSAPVNRFVEALQDHGSNDISALFRDEPAFSQGNEMDAIVSKLGPRAFSLATRAYDENGRMRAFISLAKEPDFHDRHEVRLPQLAWFAFYGKGFAWNNAFAFPAYGAARDDLPARPLILLTDDGVHWELFAEVANHADGVILNESSIVFHDGRFWLFARRDTPPFGIWRAWSDNLSHWSEPEPLIEAAQAPIAIARDGRPVMIFRRIIDEARAALAMIEPFASATPVDLDVYDGSIYDGGYGDLAELDGRLTAVYYHGNRAGEPCLKCWTA